MKPDKIPRAVRSSELDIMGIKVKCFVLDNGKRVFEAESFKMFLEKFFSNESQPTKEDIEKIACMSTGIEYIPKKTGEPT